MVYRVYVEKRPGLTAEADALFNDIRTLLRIESLEGIRLLNRYDVENITPELFDYSVKTILSEPQLDVVTDTLPEGGIVFAVEYLPGQFDQRADSAAQCIQIMSQGDRPLVRSARVYQLMGTLTAEEVAAIKKYLINPVEAREASLEPFETLAMEYEVPEGVATLEGFREMEEDALRQMVADYGLAMDLDDLRFCRDYFRSEDRDPTMTELRVIDTYWSDHCRHTTFLTTIDEVTFESPILQQTYEEYLNLRKRLNRTKPINLMDIGTIVAKYLKKQGKMPKLDESEEINACTVKIKVDTAEGKEDWLLLFKNETHNHPTEIEPFGGAATCVGGAIRDPLSGRSYVYSAMRLTGAADPLTPISETMEGKLPQRTIVTKAAAGYSSYGNQIGLATGQVDELYHPGYAAKRMEIGAVIAAAPAENVRRERPAPGDVVILLGGRTGRDGCGGATGSSKSHTMESLETCGAEVQKGNAPEERKLQRLFRNPEASRLIKRCNDFGAGGVSVAIGELAEGLEIDLNKVPKKYEGLDGTELAISESQERMAVVVEAKDADRFMELADSENLESTVVATVTDKGRLTMHWNGKNIVDIARSFLDTNGVEKHIQAVTAKPESILKEQVSNFRDGYMALAEDLNVCSKRGLSERFDSTIGSGAVMMPFGGKYQLTPTQAMVTKISMEKKDTDTCSLMAWGYNPYITEKSPYHGAYLAVIESVSKLVASGANLKETYLSFQEYFEKLGKDPKRWGKPLAALLGAFRAQKELEIAAIGGKDSMSGSFEKLDVPPTLVSFAVTTDKIDNVVSPEFKEAGHHVVWLCPEYGPDGLPAAASLKQVYQTVNRLMKKGKVCAAYTPTFGGVAEAVLKMSLGNGIGLTFDEGCTMDELFGYAYGSFVMELTDQEEVGLPLGVTTADGSLIWKDQKITGEELLARYENKLEPIYPCNISQSQGEIPAFETNCDSWKRPAVKVARPRVLIPVFPGTNCEYDAAKAMRAAGAEPEIVVIKNRSALDIAQSMDYVAQRLKESQIVFLPGGFSGGDEPDGSAKFITAFFRAGKVKEQVNDLLKNRDGLMLGICNGFQALIKLGLVPYGEIIDTDETCPTLTFNTIGRHQSRLVRTRVASNLSPWLMNTKPGEVYTVPISHGEGRFLASEELIKKLAENGQIATQYVDLSGNPTADIHFNPNNSACAVEGITSPDGRVLGKMGHSERTGAGLYRNVPGDYDMKLFRSAVEYFK
ncbi:MAG: phosphoribosylformylglycinamidine synthase [Evtepia sp.]|uniref:phosphoribosylformylglycinamidine synthase n=1 Tax=Evtepia sp. TaxID=2773933 RepID=UPI002A761152|nr:phosphoribosylformylglycinamidine synthase [Evtepia sp.]MDY3014190.1 phosphoribosylformylglycinamidine synthase [Evtepia sp.]